MFDDYISDIESNLEKRKPDYVSDRLNYIFNYITEANTYVDVLLAGDLFAYANGGEKYESDYYRLLWYRTQYVTETYALASLIYSAWTDAGKPDLNKL